MISTAKRAVLSTVVTAAALGSVVFSGAQASAAPAALTCSAQYVTGSGGHRGAAVTCNGGWFRGGIWCERNDNHYRYQHIGYAVASGRVSTVWCDLNAFVVSYFHEVV
ncbi:hypothetical protein JOF53_008271 [Crossiella equi]|uniref:Uncharacterized protein n=1 Tax=Crossiella equi TaxID=130796 RepID=A0ABS5AS37_9PSEU|nr:hypothetical protein [Crossiella equi]MBP2479399.1 hypothetical protein [Crossiella equi]